MNRTNCCLVSPSARQEINDKDAKIRKLEADLHFYKKHLLGNNYK